MIKTAIAGYGYSARTFHIPYIQSMEQFDLTGVSTGRGAEASEALPGVQIFSSAEEMIRDADAELIIITTPNTAHFPLARLALISNKHVIVEKPFVIDVKRGEELISLSEKQKRVLSVFQNRRWDGDFLTVKKLMETERLGEIRCFESHYDRFRPFVRDRWRERPGEGAGVWFDLGPHLVDQALQLFGLPGSVSGRCRPIRDNSSVTDYFHVQLHYPDKEIVLHGSPFSAGPKLRFHLEGTLGTYIKYGFDSQEEILKTGVIPSAEMQKSHPAYTDGRLYSGSGSSDLETEAGNYKAFFTGIADAVSHGGISPVSAEDALDNIRIIQSVLESGKTGKLVSSIM